MRNGGELSFPQRRGEPVELSGHQREHGERPRFRDLASVLWFSRGRIGARRPAVLVHRRLVEDQAEFHADHGTALWARYGKNGQRVWASAGSRAVRPGAGETGTATEPKLRAA